MEDKAYKVVLCGEINDTEFDDLEVATAYAECAVENKLARWAIVINNENRWIIKEFYEEEGK